jgi:hypothetical protein
MNNGVDPDACVSEACYWWWAAVAGVDTTTPSFGPPFGPKLARAVGLDRMIAFVRTASCAARLRWRPSTRPAPDPVRRDAAGRIVAEALTRSGFAGPGEASARAVPAGRAVLRDAARWFQFSARHRPMRIPAFPANSGPRDAGVAVLPHGSMTRLERTADRDAPRAPVTIDMSAVEE